MRWWDKPPRAKAALGAGELASVEQTMDGPCFARVIGPAHPLVDPRLRPHEE
jgi:hypothetical protein